jgi:hypothetical protein
MWIYDERKLAKGTIFEGMIDLFGLDLFYVELAYSAKIHQCPFGVGT